MTTEPSVTEDTWPCSVCGELAGPDARSDCYRCGEYFHLRLTTTATGPDCGDVWLDDEVMALQFACRNCLAEQAGETAPPGQEPPPPEEPSEPALPRARRATGGTSARDLARRRR
ncbi:MAG: hypothetical protein OXD50_15920 [Chloroflexi bacterium]|nr:hypothetical protein [Chloroflexota bacterium]